MSCHLPLPSPIQPAITSPPSDLSGAAIPVSSSAAVNSAAWPAGILSPTPPAGEAPVSSMPRTATSSSVPLRFTIRSTLTCFVLLAGLNVAIR